MIYLQAMENSLPNAQQFSASVKLEASNWKCSVTGRAGDISDTKLGNNDII
jgi:hypothetical protein